MTVEGYQRAVRLGFARLRLPACAGHCLWVELWLWETGIVADDIVEVRLVSHGRDTALVLSLLVLREKKERNARDRTLTEVRRLECRQLEGYPVVGLRCLRSRFPLTYHGHVNE